MKEWFTAAELADLALPDLPATKRGVNKVAKTKQWAQRRSVAGAMLCRRREGNGGGTEYHYTVLPSAAQAQLVKAAREAAKATPIKRGVGQAWDAFDRLPAKAKEKAEARLCALESVEALTRGGLQKNSAVARVAAETGNSPRTIFNWYDLVAGVDRKDWLPMLAPRHRGRAPSAECSPEAFAAFKADYLRQEQPPAEACYDRVLDVAAERGWTVPSLKTLMRRIEREVPKAVQVLWRQGPEALKRMYPAQERDRSHFHALQAVNADGHKADVWVRFPDGEEVRPMVMAVQDLYSGKILAWRVDKSATATGVRLAFHDVFRDFGIPDLAYLDNGREFASKMITGGQATRFRFAVKPDEMAGVLTTLGVEVHWTTPYSGQSKPIERAFRSVCDRISKHPALAGAYAGNSPTNKPEYTVKAVDFDTFLATFERGINAHNAKAGRRSRVCGGIRSFDQAFADSYAHSPIKKAGPEQLRMAMLAAESVKARKPDGAIHFQGNRYWSEFLADHIGESMTVRFDPDALHAGVHLYRSNGMFLGEAECWEAAGFDSVDAARTHGRKRREFMKATKRAAELEEEMTIEEWVRMQPDIAEPPAAPETKTVRLVTGSNALAPKPQHQIDEDADQETGGFDHAGFSRGLQLIEGSRE